MVNFVNPFAGDQTTVGVSALYNKPTGIVQDPPIIPLPDAPATQSISFGSANLAASLIGISTALSLSASNNITSFNAQEVLALQNTQTLFTGFGAGAHVLTRAQLQDVMVSVLAIQNAVQSGAFMSVGDFSNANVGFGSANTGWFPDGAQTITCLNGKMVAEDPQTGSFYWSNTTLLSAVNASGNGTGLQGGAADWSVLNQGSMASFSDQPLAMDQLGSLLVSFGIQSTQFYNDGDGGPGITNSFSVPQQGTTQQIGLAAVFGRTDFMNGLAFLGQLKTGQAHVYFLQEGGYVPQIISNPDIDQIINSFQALNDCIFYAYDNNGHQFLRATFPSAGRTFDYDGTSGTWAEVQSGVMDEYGRHVTGLAVSFNGQTIAGDCATGNVYLLDPTNASDNGFLVRREFTTMHLQNEGNRFTVAELWLDVNTGQVSNVYSEQRQGSTLISAAQNTVFQLTAQSSLGTCNFVGFLNSAPHGAISPTTINGYPIVQLGQFCSLFGTFPGVLTMDIGGNPPNTMINYIQVNAGFGGNTQHTSYWSQPGFANGAGIIGWNEVEAPGEFEFGLADGSGVNHGPWTVTINWNGVGVSDSVLVTNITANGNQDPGYMSQPFATVFGNHIEGNVNTAALFGCNIGAIVGGNVQAGTPSFLSVYLEGIPPQGVFTTVSGVDQNGVAFTLTSASASYTADVLNSGYTEWTWNYPSAPVFPPNGGSLALTFSNPGASQVITTSQPITPSIDMYWSIDNGNTWKGPRKKSLGSGGEFGKRLIWRKVGNARDFVFKFVLTDPVPITFVRVVANIIPGTS